VAYLGFWLRGLHPIGAAPLPYCFLLPFPFPSPSLSYSIPQPFPSVPLEVGPLNTTGGLGSAVSAASQQDNYINSISPCDTGTMTLQTADISFKTFTFNLCFPHKTQKLVYVSRCNLLTPVD